MIDYRKISILFALIFSALLSSAQTVADLWVAMPSEMIPYITQNDRKEMIECVNIGVDTSVNNKLNGKTKVDTLSNDYGRFILSSVKQLQLVKLPQNDSDGILCMISTLSTSDRTSKVEFYDMKWNRLNTSDYLPNICSADLMCKPDTMSVEHYDSIASLIDYDLFSYDYNPNEDVLNVSLSTTLTTKEEKNTLDAIIIKQKLIWNGKSFK